MIKRKYKGLLAEMPSRLFMLMAHYRSILDITQKGLEDAEKIENVLAASFRPEQEDNREEISQKKTSPQLKAKIAQWRQSCFDSMNDDFNTPKLVSRFGDKKIHALFEGKNAPAKYLSKMKTAWLQPIGCFFATYSASFLKKMPYQRNQIRR